jgi:hypothetical protein
VSVIRMRAFGLRISLGHVRPFLGLTVISRPIAVVDVARRIHPYQARTASRRLRHRRGLRRWGGLRRWRRSRSRCRGWGRSRSSLRRRRRSRGWSLCRRRSTRRIPLLHTLMSPASPLFAGGSRIRPIFTLSSRSGGCLSHRHLRRQKPCRNRHQPSHRLHKRSR